MSIIITLLFFLLLQCKGIIINNNILLIIVDDLRPALGCYGDVNAYTPNIDKLADKSVVFTQAYAQQALCAPSRNSLLTSRRPDTLGLYDFNSYWRNYLNYTTLPQHLKDNGYITKSIGKIFHPGITSNYSDDSPYSWTDNPFHPITDKYKNAPVCPTVNTTDTNAADQLARNLICPVNVIVTPQSTLPDIENLNAAKNFLSNYYSSLSTRPFFLAVGFEKPHIPFKYPKQYLKFHPISKFKLNNYYWPENISSVAYNPWIDLRKRTDVNNLHIKFPWEKIPNYFARKIIQSYYASVSYIDNLIGQIIDKLIELNIDKSTTVILTSDHGWSLGEHSLWAKYSNFDVAVRVPLIVSLSNYNKKYTTKVHYTKSIVELVDLFPTIAQLTGLSIPICKNIFTLTCTEGISFLPVIQSIFSSKNKTIKWKKAAFSQYPRPGLIPTWKPNSDEPQLNKIKIMGYTLRTQRYRYTAWIPFHRRLQNNNNFIFLDWNNFIAEELYDHTSDPNEMINLQANNYYFKIKNKLFQLLKSGWKKALPR